MQRYFVKNHAIRGKSALIQGRDHHHIKNVMRMRPKDKVYLCDENENVYLAEIAVISQQEIVLNIIDQIDHKSELEVSTTIALGLTRREKQEEVLKRITELGASGFLTVALERSVVKAGEKSDSIRERHWSIAKEAAEQSHRRRIPSIYGHFSFPDFLNFSEQFDLCLFAYEEAGRKGDASLKSIIRSFRGKSVLALVGPEGGFSQKEAEVLMQRGFVPVGLGPRILRCETAPLYIMSAFSYELELKDES